TVTCQLVPVTQLPHSGAKRIPGGLQLRDAVLGVGLLVDAVLSHDTAKITGRSQIIEVKCP
ncbi:hypothetical protein ACKU3I_029675, partial [Serratia marcescens]